MLQIVGWVGGWGGGECQKKVLCPGRHVIDCKIILSVIMCYLNTLEGTLGQMQHYSPVKDFLPKLT
jgi:hypothetical protein